MADSEPAPPLLTRILLRENWIGLACLAILCALAWWWLLRMGAAMPVENAPEAMPGMSPMPGMASSDAGSSVWGLAYLGPAFTMWVVMMVAMMLPSASPMILMHAAFTRHRQASRAAPAVFALTYLLLWILFAALAVAGQALLVQLGLIEEASLVLGNRTLAAVLLIATALYQLSPLKRLCLSLCRSPAIFLMQHWRPGVAGAVRMGLAHGIYCIGCCGLLMLLLFVGGVMNLAWVALITVVVVAEKYAPPILRANLLLSGVLLVGAAILLLS